ncbi:glycerol/1,2-propanediol dehydratase [Citrifermentans bemidjiense Bem]|uniref:Glycerol/1,2-propanediol dehydratase n=1 Tax=Citrifermentans bemidjiense (strain ATCC BAA-1014 / DSM 16622 / JCM 12645 / Bem) TaxID=404380 RepID=B5EGM4_CITBB|nr:trans-4-hydroxy-L-proline dehydratase [Citrifermentans bemidjiense]ACH39507.1 glycerol/1,2-propanediol dehydratase [Citrifermentans bemidjiense Bem]
MTGRTERLRQESLDAEAAISAERALLLTEFYRENEGRWSIPVLRAKSFYYLCEKKTIYLGDGELVVGERGPAPKLVPTYPELTCHSLKDLRILNSREKTSYRVDDACLKAYGETVIPYWSTRSLRDKIFRELPEEWHEAYQSGIFTEFMEQRAPGHTVLDDKIYNKGLLDFKKEIADAIAALDFVSDPNAWSKREELKAMDISCDAVILFAERHAKLAESMAAACADAVRKQELLKIAANCRWVPAHAPTDFFEALQSYWFCHLAVITELNGWDAFSPGHLDQHLYPFYRDGLAAGTLKKEEARELLECFFVKFNNHPSPPKVGVTAAESGTYTDFANINLGGLLPDGSDGSNEVSHLLLDIIDEMHLLQPSSNIQLSRKSPDRFLKHTLRVVRKGYGFPSIFNADSVVEEQLRQGKTLADARAGGCSGCVEVGAFGKEAYILTGYFNLVKMLELALHDGVDPATGAQLGPATGKTESFACFDDVFAAFTRQLAHFIDIKIRGNRLIEMIYAGLMPAPFLSVLTDDCISRGVDYNAGGARYNNSFIQGVGIGSITDSLSAIKEHVFQEKAVSLPDLVAKLDADFASDEPLRQRLWNRTRKYGNDDDFADDLMRQVFEAFFQQVDGRPNTKGGVYRIEMLPTTCHVYFGSVTGAMPDGRRRGAPLSEGISPVQGADRQGPTAVIRSAGKMDHIRSGGTLLNLKFSPTLLAGEGGVDGLAALVRSYFRMDGHHVQFNVVDVETLKRAQADPRQYRDLIVRVAGYSDYFCDLSEELQNEIIARTEHTSL